jgi:predicted ribosome quality control (RQC) complex YloA/Tae2 family protein
MRIRISINKSVHENAAAYYEKAKEAKKKIAGTEEAIKKTEAEIRAFKGKEKKTVRVKRDKEWFEKFHWFLTSEGKLAIGGKDAQQNDLVFKKHMDDADLFFHSDIQGGSAVILKDGKNASEQELLEAAQFAASYSNAWKNANSLVDVYAVSKNQVSKHAQGGFIPAGAFAISGERRWFRKTKLAVRVGIGADEKPAEVLPECSKRKLKHEVLLVPSKTGKEKGEIAKQVAKPLDADINDILQIIPSGKSRIVQT